MPGESSYVRWQLISINQLGYAIGLILSFATASLGFVLSLVKDQNYSPGCWGKVLMLISVTFLIVSVGLGLWGVVNRLCDFRQTRSVARDREDWQKDGVSQVDIDNRLRSRRERTRKLGKRTWLLFWWQIGTFAVGVVTFTAAFGITYRAKLF